MANDPAISKWENIRLIPLKSRPSREIASYVDATFASSETQMPYDLIYKNTGFFLTHTGIISREEISEANGVIHGHVEFDAHTFQIINLLEADFSEILNVHARDPGATDSAASKIRKHVKVAIVVSELKAVEFCEHYIQVAKRLGSDWEFQLFPDENAALNWVGA